MRIDLGKKLNYAREVFMDGCDAPFTAYLEAAKPALIHAALNYYCLDPVQIFTGWARPVSPLKGNRKDGHGRGKGSPKGGNKKWRSFRRVFGFYPNEWVGKKMPFSDEMERRQVPNGARVMWAGFGQLQRFQNAMFIYQVAEDFFYEIALGVAQSEYCKEQRASVFFGESKDAYNFGVLGLTACQIEQVLKIRNVSFTAGNGVTPHVPRYTAFFSVGSTSLEDTGGGSSGCFIRIQPPDGPAVDAELPSNGGGTSVAVGVSEGGFVSFHLGGPRSYWAYDIQFHIVGRRNEPTYRAPGWCNDLANQAINWAQS